MFNEVYLYLSKIKKMDKKVYNRLITIYNKEVVSSVIEYMINENEKNILKFEYYVETLMSNIDGNLSVKSNFDIYMREVGAIRRFSDEENESYAKEAYNIVNELREIFIQFNVKYINEKGNLFNSIMDEVEYYIKECSDRVVIDRIKELSIRYIIVRNKLVEGNLRLVISAARPLFDNSRTFLEIIQYGNIGLMRAVEKYNPNMGAKFITYAYYWIKQSFRNFNKANLDAGSSVSYYAMNINNTRIKAINKLVNELGREPTEVEIASQMGISSKKLSEIENAFGESVSLDSSALEANDNFGRDTSLVDTIADLDVNVEDEVCSKIFCDQIWDILRNILNEKQFMVMMYRCGSYYNNNLSMQQIANIMGVSRQRAQQYEKTAITKARRYFNKKENRLDYGYNVKG